MLLLRFLVYAGLQTIDWPALTPISLGNNASITIPKHFLWKLVCAILKII